MSDKREIRRLSAKWGSGQGWPKRLEWLELDGLRGWSGQRFVLQYPLMALVGENGVGKSTILQAIASVYKSPDKARFASDFFPDTFWEKIQNAAIRYSIRGGQIAIGEGVQSVRKPGERWRGNPERAERNVAYIDLRRVQPVPARLGYTRLVKGHHEEVSATLFDSVKLNRFSQIMGRQYELAKMALTDADPKRPVPVLAQQGTTYSGFHQGAGETTIAELLDVDLPKYSIVLIDEVESSLHPRAQRRLIRDLADRCRDREWQVVLTTHSPYVLGELPAEARAYIMQMGSTREIVYGVSPEFAMTRMDDVPQPECDLYVEDVRAQVLLIEVMVKHAKNTSLVQRCQIIPYGAASVGRALGQMVSKNLFPRPSRVFLDGDQAPSVGCINLPGEDAPERVVFEALAVKNWAGVSDRVGRQFADVADVCTRAMTLTDHHEWVTDAATNLVLSGSTLWQAMCAEWVTRILEPRQGQELTVAVEDALLGIATDSPVRETGGLEAERETNSQTKRKGVQTKRGRPRVSRGPSLFPPDGET